jgi:hypothetical protein
MGDLEEESLNLFLNNETLQLEEALLNSLTNDDNNTEILKSLFEKEAKRLSVILKYLIIDSVLDPSSSQIQLVKELLDKTYLGKYLDANLCDMLSFKVGNRNIIKPCRCNR